MIDILIILTRYYCDIELINDIKIPELSLEMYQILSEASHIHYTCTYTYS